MLSTGQSMCWSDIHGPHHFTYLLVMICVSLGLSDLHFVKCDIILSYARREEQSEIDVTSGFYVLFGSGKNQCLSIVIVYSLSFPQALSSKFQTNCLKNIPLLWRSTYVNLMWSMYIFVERTLKCRAFLTLLLLTIFMHSTGLMLSFILSIYILQSSRDKLARYASEILGYFVTWKIEFRNKLSKFNQCCMVIQALLYLFFW